MSHHKAQRTKNNGLKVLLATARSMQVHEPKTFKSGRLSMSLSLAFSACTHATPVPPPTGVVVTDVVDSESSQAVTEPEEVAEKAVAAILKSSQVEIWPPASCLSVGEIATYKINAPWECHVVLCVDEHCTQVEVIVKRQDMSVAQTELDCCQDAPERCSVQMSSTDANLTMRNILRENDLVYDHANDLPLDAALKFDASRGNLCGCTGFLPEEGWRQARGAFLNVRILRRALGPHHRDHRRLISARLVGITRSDDARAPSPSRLPLCAVGNHHQRRPKSEQRPCTPTQPSRREKLIDTP